MWMKPVTEALQFNGSYCKTMEDNHCMSYTTKIGKFLTQGLLKPCSSVSPKVKELMFELDEGEEVQDDFYIWFSIQGRAIPHFFKKSKPSQRESSI